MFIPYQSLHEKTHAIRKHVKHSLTKKFILVSFENSEVKSLHICFKIWKRSVRILKSSTFGLYKPALFRQHKPRLLRVRADPLLPASLPCIRRKGAFRPLCPKEG